MGRSGGMGGLLPARGGSEPTLLGGGGAADGLKFPLPGRPEGGGGGRGPKNTQIIKQRVRDINQMNRNYV